MKLRILATLLVLLSALPVSAQSWCQTGASLNPTEIAICTDPILGNLDIEMTRLYDQTKPADQRACLECCRHVAGVLRVVDRTRIRRSRNKSSLLPAAPVSPSQNWIEWTA